jgi:hypothetical protein
MKEKIIDFHAHIYPEKIAAKATHTVSEFYDTTSAWTGLVSELLESGANIGVNWYVVHSTATKPEQVESINNFILDEVQKHPCFIGFGTIHPAYPDPATELDRIVRAGLRGIKLHPDFQKFKIDTPEMDPIYELLAEMDVPILVHAGDIRYDFSGPRRIRHVLDRHPHLRIVAAHFGGYTEWEESLELLAGRDIWFDTSSTSWKLPPEAQLNIIAKHGISRFFFGSDFPMWDHTDELARFEQLHLSSSDRQAVLYNNAAEFLKIRE